MTTIEAPAAAVTESITATKHTLANGLRVVVVPDHSAPLVGVNLTYRVGSRDEPAGRTGFAHLFEHLMFQGSANVAPGELSTSLSEVGAQPNAATFFDWTMYHEAVPVAALELALWFEADRMGGFLAALDQETLDTERDVVKNERRQDYEGRPYGTAWELLHAALFPQTHPYHWLPIGSMVDIDAATLEDVRSFFATHYGPNNCVLTLAGDVTAQEAIALVETYFGGIPTNPRIPDDAATSIEPGSAQIRLEGPEPGPVPAIFAAYRGPASRSSDYVALEVASQILAGGAASRLNDRLLRREEAVRTIDCGLTPLLGEVTTVVVSAILSDAVETDQVEQIIDAEIAELARTAPSAAELQRATAQLERRLWEDVATVEGRAEFYGVAEAFFPGDRDPVEETLAHLGDVTPEAVSAAVRTWLVPENRVVLTYEGGAPEEFDDEFEGARAPYTGEFDEETS
ncbi:MAG: pitrilysin family protein [Actinomycetia bacterium]|nr:pitrilysin family protein [Actinomycetes bacterium]